MAAVVSGRVKKSGRGHFGLLNDCWNVVVCERVCFFVCMNFSMCLQVCVYTRLSAALCFAVDSHLSILAGT